MSTTHGDGSSSGLESMVSPAAKAYKYGDFAGIKQALAALQSSGQHCMVGVKTLLGIRAGIYACIG